MSSALTQIWGKDSDPKTRYDRMLSCFTKMHTTRAHKLPPPGSGWLEEHAAHFRLHNCKLVIIRGRRVDENDSGWRC